MDCKYKNLTAQQCVDIAKIVAPKVDWRYYDSPHEDKYEGHEVVSEERNDYGFKYILQIGWDGRILYYDDGYTHVLNFREYQKINEYLASHVG